MIKEETETKVAGVFISIAVNALSFWGVLILIIALTLLNLEYYRGMLVNDTLVECFQEYADDEIDVLDEYDIDASDLYTKDFIKHLMNDYINAAFLGDKDFDEDFYSDYFLDTIVPIVEEEYDQKIPPSEIKREKAEFIQNLRDGFNDIDETDAGSTLNTSRNTALTISLVMLGGAVGLSVLMVCIYRNKLRAFRNISIALFISMLIEFLCFVGLRALFVAAFEDMETENEIEHALLPLYDQFKESFLKTPVVILGVLVGLLLISLILCSIFAAKAKGDPDEEDMMRASNGYAYPYGIPAAPVYNNPPMVPNGYPNPMMGQPYNQPVANPYNPMPVAAPAPVVKEPEDAKFMPPVMDSTIATDFEVANPMDNTWTCSRGHSGNVSSFCVQCGERRQQ